MRLVQSAPAQEWRYTFRLRWIKWWSWMYIRPSAICRIISFLSSGERGVLEPHGTRKGTHTSRIWCIERGKCDDSPAQCMDTGYCTCTYHRSRNEEKSSKTYRNQMGMTEIDVGTDGPVNVDLAGWGIKQEAIPWFLRRYYYIDRS